MTGLAVLGDGELPPARMRPTTTAGEGWPPAMGSYIPAMRGDQQWRGEPQWQQQASSTNHCLFRIMHIYIDTHFK